MLIHLKKNARFLLFASLAWGFFFHGVTFAQQADSSVLCKDYKARFAEMTYVWDYRNRDASDQMRYQIRDNAQNHLNPARNRMQQLDFSRPVMADLDFTFLRYPNHLVAFDLLLKYIFAGGKEYEFGPFQCYFENAKSFAPDDARVILVEAYYNWRKGDKARAKDLYGTALGLDPNSAAAHYNLGLIFLEEKDFAKASEHAVAAYSLGYPFSALKDKLKMAGHPLPEIPASKAAAE